MHSSQAGLQANEFAQTVWTYSTALAFALFLVSIFILWGYRARMPRSRFLVWVAVIVLLPIVGPILWFVRRKRAYPPQDDALLKPLPKGSKLD